METTPCSHRRRVGCPVPDDCPKDLQTGRFKHSGWDPLAWPPGCQQNLQEVLRPFVLAQSKKSCGAILQVVSHLLDGFETESDRSKSTVTATTSPSRAIQQKNRCWLFRATTLSGKLAPKLSSLSVISQKVGFLLFVCYNTLHLHNGLFAVKFCCFHRYCTGKRFSSSLQRVTLLFSWFYSKPRFFLWLAEWQRFC